MFHKVQTHWISKVFGIALLFALIAISGIGSIHDVAASPTIQGNPGNATPVPVAPVYRYSVKFVCGISQDSNPAATVRPGIYGTEINIHNPHLQQQGVKKHVLILVDNGKPVGREPNFVSVKGTDSIVLPTNTATMDDCQRIAELTGPINQLTIGYLVLDTRAKLAVQAVYTASGEGAVSTIDVEKQSPIQIQ